MIRGRKDTAPTEEIIVLEWFLDKSDGGNIDLNCRYDDINWSIACITKEGCMDLYSNVDIDAELKLDNERRIVVKKTL